MRQGFLTYLILLFFTHLSYTQIEKELQDPYRTVFWIKLDLKYMRDPKLKVPVYSTQLKDKKIYVGNLKEFQQAIWAGRSNGHYIVVGPFSTHEQVEQARKLFKNKGEVDPAIESDLGTYYWYLVRLGRYSRLSSYKFLHIPAAVAEGTLRDFLGILDAARYNDAIVIGPFPSRVEAELSKRMYRQEESKTR